MGKKTDEELALEEPLDKWLVIRHYLAEDKLDEYVEPDQLCRAVKYAIRHYDKVTVQMTSLRNELKMAEKRVEDAEEAERAAIDDGYASAEVLAEEVARLSEELERQQADANAGLSGIKEVARNEVETLQSKLETQGTDFAYLTRKHEYLEQQYNDLQQRVQQDAQSGIFGGSPQLQGQLSGAQGELLKANKKSHELERHTVKLQADIKEIERELEEVILQKEQAVMEKEEQQDQFSTDLADLEDAVGATLGQKEEELRTESQRRQLAESQIVKLEARLESLNAEIEKLEQGIALPGGGGSRVDREKLEQAEAQMEALAAELKMAVEAKEGTERSKDEEIDNLKEEMDDMEDQVMSLKEETDILREEADMKLKFEQWLEESNEENVRLTDEYETKVTTMKAELTQQKMMLLAESQREFGERIAEAEEELTEQQQLQMELDEMLCIAKEDAHGKAMQIESLEMKVSQVMIEARLGGGGGGSGSGGGVVNERQRKEWESEKSAMGKQLKLLTKALQSKEDQTFAIAARDKDKAIESATAKYALQLQQAQASDDAATEQAARMANVVRALMQQLEQTEQRTADADHSTATAHQQAMEAEELVWSLEQERSELEENMGDLMTMNEELEAEAQQVKAQAEKAAQRAQTQQPGIEVPKELMLEFEQKLENAHDATAKITTEAAYEAMTGYIREMKRNKLQQQLETVQHELIQANEAKAAAEEATQAKLDKVVANWEADVEELSDQLQKSTSNDPLDESGNRSSQVAQQALEARLQLEQQSHELVKTQVVELTNRRAHLEQKLDEAQEQLVKQELEHAHLELAQGKKNPELEAELEALQQQCAEKRTRVHTLIEENFELKSEQEATVEKQRVLQQEYTTDKETLYADTVRALRDAQEERAAMSHQMDKLHRAELLAKENEFALLLQRAHAQKQPGQETDTTEETVRVLRVELQHKSLEIGMLQRKIEELQPLADQASIASNTKRATRQITQSRRATHKKRAQGQLELGLVPESEPEIRLKDDSDESVVDLDHGMPPFEKKMFSSVMWDFEWYLNRERVDKAAVQAQLDGMLTALEEQQATQQLLVGALHALEENLGEQQAELQQISSLKPQLASTVQLFLSSVQTQHTCVENTEAQWHEIAAQLVEHLLPVTELLCLPDQQQCPTNCDMLRAVALAVSCSDKVFIETRYIDSDSELSDVDLVLNIARDYKIQANVDQVDRNGQMPAASSSSDVDYGRLSSEEEDYDLSD